MKNLLLILFVFVSLSSFGQVQHLITVSVDALQVIVSHRMKNKIRYIDLLDKKSAHTVERNKTAFLQTESNQSLSDSLLAINQKDGLYNAGTFYNHSMITLGMGAAFGTAMYFVDPITGAGISIAFS
jgi:hypothetical protein